MTHRIAIIVKVLPATNCNGTRVSLRLPRWNSKSIRRSWDSALSGLERQGEAILTEAGIECESFSEISNSEYSFQVSFDQVAKVKTLFNL